MITVRRRLGALACAVVAGAALVAVVATPASSAATKKAHAVSSAMFTGYAVSRPLCALPTRADEFTCMAFRRVDVAKGTPGAHKYTIPRWAKGPSGGYTPAALAKAYSYNPKGNTRQTVAIVDWDGDPTVRADLNHFDRHYGLPAETAKSFRVVNEDGKASPLPGADQGASIEISLDVETVRSVCNKCRIILVEAKQATSASLAKAENTAVRLGATIVSNSFGAPERRGHAFPASIVRAFNHPGVVITASSGDDGFFFWDLANDDPFGFTEYAPQAPSFPASLPTVVSVGGTALKLKTDGTRDSESVWNSNGEADAQGNNNNASLGASGGGCSTLFKSPTWQRSNSGYKASGCAGKRLSVDVSAAADPMPGFDVYDSYGLNGWAPIGGTSWSSPIIAGLWGLAGGAHGMPNAARALYQNLHLRSSTLHDVTVGGNGWCGGVSTTDCKKAAAELGSNNPNWVYDAEVDCSFPRRNDVHNTPAKSRECNATTGYDGASGVGTPDGIKAFRTTSPYVRVTASPQHHRKVTFTAHVTAVVKGSSLRSTTWFWGDKSKATTTSRSAAQHHFVKPGRYSVRVRVRDSHGQVVVATKTVRIT